MEYKKIINLLYNTPDQPNKFWTKNCVEIRDDSRGTYSIDSQIKFKISMLNSSLCDYSNAYILVKGIITLVGQGAAAQARQNNRNDKQVLFKNPAPFTDCLTEINNTQVDNIKVCLGQEQHE